VGSGARTIDRSQFNRILFNPGTFDRQLFDKHGHLIDSHVINNHIKPIAITSTLQPFKNYYGEGSIILLKHQNTITVRKGRPTVLKLS